MTPKRSGPGALAGATETGTGCAERQAASDRTAPPATTRQQPRLNRETFRASRLLEFCSERNPSRRPATLMPSWISSASTIPVRSRRADNE
jgi:hypothetical protein